MSEEKENASGNKSTGTEYLHHMSIKPPVFTETSAVGWFFIMESQFRLKGITVESTKFFHVITALPADLVSNLPADILEGNNFTNLKKAVIDIYEKTKPELFDKLISSTTMSGRPSIYLQELSTLAGKVGVHEDLVRHKFLQSLPSSLSPALATQKEVPLRQLGTLADELMPLCKSGDNSAQISQASASSSRPQKFYSKNKNSSNESNDHIPFGLRPFTSNQKPKVCKAHLYYASKARSCKPWCQWPQKKPSKIEPSSRNASPSRSNQEENSQSGK